MEEYYLYSTVRSDKDSPIPLKVQASGVGLITLIRIPQRLFRGLTEKLKQDLLHGCTHKNCYVWDLTVEFEFNVELTDICYLPYELILSKDLPSNQIFPRVEVDIEHTVEVLGEKLNVIFETDDIIILKKNKQGK